MLIINDLYLQIVTSASENDSPYFYLEIIYRSRCYFVVNHCAKVLSFIDTVAVLMNNHISRTFPG